MLTESVGRATGLSWPLMGIARPASGHSYHNRRQNGSCQRIRSGSPQCSNVGWGFQGCFSLNNKRDWWEKSPGTRSRSRVMKISRTSGLFDAGFDLLPALRAALGIEHFLAQANRFRGDLHEFVVSDKFDRLLERHVAGRNQTNGFVRGGRTHIGLFLFFGDVDVHVVFARVLADDHAFVDFDRGSYEHIAALLNAPDGVGGRHT